MKMRTGHDVPPFRAHHVGAAEDRVLKKIRRRNIRTRIRHRSRCSTHRALWHAGGLLGHAANRTLGRNLRRETNTLLLPHGRCHFHACPGRVGIEILYHTHSIRRPFWWCCGGGVGSGD